jgi:hypothetical protein
MLNFTYDIPTRIFFGRNQIDYLSGEIKKYGSRTLMVYGGGSIKKNGIYDAVIQQLNEGNIFYKELPGVKPNPSISSVREGSGLCKENKLDFVLAVGGGSTLDCAKVISAAAMYEGDPWDFVTGKAVIQNALPLGTVLTLSATGSEMNSGAVISNEETQDKLPVLSDYLKPRFSILDPAYTFTVNPYYTAAGVADIMSHIFEQYFVQIPFADVPDRMCEALLKVCIKYGPVVIENPEDYQARANIMWASSLALNSLVNLGKVTGDWAVHFIEHEISAIYDVTHGIGLAILIPHWMEYVLSDQTLPKFVDYGKNVWNIREGSDLEIAENSIVKTYNFFRSLGIPMHLRDVRVDEKRLDEIAARAMRLDFGTGTIGQFKPLKKEDILNILIHAA